MDQTSGTTQRDAPAAPHAEAPPAPAPDAASSSPEPPGFQPRGRARRRARFLRKARELAYRDLGGLVFNLHRFGQRNDALVLAKLTTLGQIDGELRAIEGSLDERRPITVLREAGITACARCAAIHSSEDSFCPNCGLSMGRRVDLPIAGAAPVAPPPSPQQPPAAASAAAPAEPPQATATPAPSPPSPAAAPAPAAAGAPASPPATGRSPTPPAGSVSPSGAASGAIEEDRPTEILRPPAGS